MDSDLGSDLFHEFLHWYHALRDPRRYYDEIFGFFLPVEQAVRKHPICQGIWNCDSNTTDEEILCSIKAWHTHEYNDGNCLDLEELRTIIGTKEQKYFFQDEDGFFIGTFANGDELSENLYRRFANLPCRVGYQAFNYYEDKSVIERCVALTNLTGLSKRQPKWDFLAKKAATWDCLMSSYYDSHNEKGIGKMRIPYSKITNITRRGVIKAITDNISRAVSWVVEGVRALLS
jgi:hypothetical protein